MKPGATVIEARARSLARSRWPAQPLRSKRGSIGSNYERNPVSRAHANTTQPPPCLGQPLLRDRRAALSTDSRPDSENRCSIHSATGRRRADWLLVRPVPLTVRRTLVLPRPCKEVADGPGTPSKPPTVPGRMPRSGRSPLHDKTESRQAPRCWLPARPRLVLEISRVSCAGVSS